MCDYRNIYEYNYVTNESMEVKSDGRDEDEFDWVLRELFEIEELNAMVITGEDLDADDEDLDVLGESEDFLDVGDIPVDVFQDAVKMIDFQKSHGRNK